MKETKSTPTNESIVGTTVYMVRYTIIRKTTKETVWSSGYIHDTAIYSTRESAIAGAESFCGHPLDFGNYNSAETKQTAGLGRSKFYTRFIIYEKTIC